MGHKQARLLVVAVLALLVAMPVPLQGRASSETNSDESRHLIVGVNGMPNGLDPGWAIGQHPFRTLYSVFDGLIAWNYEAQRLEPSLARSWMWESDTSLRLEIRNDVLFHDGTGLHARDVVFTFERILDPESRYATARGYFANVESVEALGPYTVRITTKTPDPVLEYLLTTSAAYVIPRDYYLGVGGFEGFNAAPVGTGPYLFVEFRPQEMLHLSAFNEYWQGKPPAESVIFREIPETSARIAALVTGEVDIITAIPPDQLPLLRRYEDIQVESVKLSNIHLLRYNTTNKALQSAAIRQAMNLSIDREELVDVLWDGRTEVPRGHQFVQFGEFYDSSKEVPEYDPARARELIEESDYDGEEIVFNAHPSYYTNGLRAAEIIVEKWRSVGLNVRLRVVEDLRELFGLKPDDPNAGVNSWSNSMRYPDPAGGLWALWHPGTGPQAYGYWDAPDEFNELGETLTTTTNPEVRAVAFQRMLHIWEEEAPGAVLYYPIESYGIRRGIDWQPYTDFHMDFRGSNLSF